MWTHFILLFCTSYSFNGIPEAKLSLTALVYNLRRALNILGVEAVMVRNVGYLGKFP